eukprot:6457499-Amphidinium_carterae.1
MAVEVPLSLGRTCGTVCTIVVPGDIPFLVPLPLLKSLGAVMHLGKEQMRWNDGSQSALITLASGHTAISLSDHLAQFAHSVPNASEFRRSEVHEQLRKELERTDVHVARAVPATSSTLSTSMMTSLPVQPSSEQQALGVAAAAIHGSGASHHRTVVEQRKEEQWLGGRGNSMCQGFRGLVEAPDPQVSCGSSGGDLCCPHSGTSGFGESAKSEHHRSGELIKGLSHQGTNACTAKNEECDSRGHSKVSTEARGLSAHGGACTRIPTRVLVDMQDLPSSVASQPARVPPAGSTVASVSFDDWLTCYGIDEETDSDSATWLEAKEVATTRLQERFENADQLKDIVNNKQVGRLVGFDDKGVLVEVWWSDATFPSTLGLCRGRHFGVDLCGREETFLVDCMSPLEVWSQVSDGKYGMGALYMSAQRSACRVQIHEPLSAFPEEPLRANSPAWRTQLGFDAGGKPRTVKQFWLALGRKQRQSRLDGSGVLTFWTNTETEADLTAQGLWKTWQESPQCQQAWRQARAHPGFSTRVLSTSSLDCPIVLLAENNDNLTLKAKEVNMAEQTVKVKNCEITSNCPEMVAHCHLVQNEVQGKLDHLRVVKELVLRHLRRRGVHASDVEQEPTDESEQDRAFRVLKSLKFPHKETRKGFEQTSALQFGLVTARGHDHISPDTYRYPDALAAAHVLARMRSSDTACPYLAVSVNCGGADWHTDKGNLGLSATMSFGNFTGGLLQVEDKLLDTRNQWTLFSGQVPHRVTSWQGDRRSVSLYVPQGLERLSGQVWLGLLSFGFPVLDFCREPCGAALAETPVARTCALQLAVDGTALTETPVARTCALQLA